MTSTPPACYHLPYISEAPLESPYVNEPLKSFFKFCTTTKDLLPTKRANFTGGIANYNLGGEAGPNASEQSDPLLAGKGT